MQNNSDEFWMKQAIINARISEKIDEVPVGAVIVKNNEVIGNGYNLMITNNDASAHAEIQALRSAGERLNNYRVVDATLYVTLEPCMMCVGAMVHARLNRVVFGAFDHKTGMVITKDTCFDKDYHNHKIEVQGGILEMECSGLLKDFFKKKRLRANKKPA